MRPSAWQRVVQLPGESPGACRNRSLNPFWSKSATKICATLAAPTLSAVASPGKTVYGSDASVSPVSSRRCGEVSGGGGGEVSGSGGGGGFEYMTRESASSENAFMSCATPLMLGVPDWLE